MYLAAKQKVYDFWEAAACGEAMYAKGDNLAEQLDAQQQARFELEAHLRAFARFPDGRGKDVLEIGVGMGADHLEWARQGPRSLAGIDLTPRAVSLTQQRLALHGLSSDVRVGDAESLPFHDGSFDIVYSYGVLHHTPNTARAVEEVYRVLRPGGSARVMIYHRYSMVGYMLWCRYGLLCGRPRMSLSEAYARYLESPGTQAFSLDEARTMFKSFQSVQISTELGIGDLLEGGAGQRHQGMLLSAARALYPRRLVRRFLVNHGLTMLVTATR